MPDQIISKRQGGAALGVILAGGLARRMGGGDKCLKPLGDRSLLEWAIARLQPQVEQLVLNANGDPARFSAFGVAVAADDPPGFLGPLAGVLAGMDRAAALGFEQIVTVAADTPFFPLDLATRLRTAAERSGVPIALAATKPQNAEEKAVRHPTFGVWRTELRGRLRAALVDEGVRKIVAWTDAQGCATASFERLAPPGVEQGFDPFFNVNTPEELAQAEAVRGAVVEGGW
ncbi:MAG: molybdenum cofactor guanylyltransferase MobA [Neomegalonema sp.]|nr:molybdenum cofactor guanylyltransferase MobA [Neomegalonema sp.]